MLTQDAGAGWSAIAGSTTTDMTRLSNLPPGVSVFDEHINRGEDQHSINKGNEMKTFSDIKIGQTFCYFGTQYTKIDASHVLLADRGAVPLSFSPTTRITP